MVIFSECGGVFVVNKSGIENGFHCIQVIKIVDVFGCVKLLDAKDIRIDLVEFGQNQAARFFVFFPVVKIKQHAIV